MKVGAYAESWLKRKIERGEIDESTGSVYAAALEDHVLPYLGDIFFDALTKEDVEEWIDVSLRKKWSTSRRRAKGTAAKCRRGGRGKCSAKCGCARLPVDKPYSRTTVQNWYRVLRTMARDAVTDLGLTQDPTLRVKFAQGDGGKPAMKEEQLVAFLEAMRSGHEAHYALVAMLAYSGLRFAHASALRWSDWDEEAQVITVVRKQYRGRVGAISKKKLANPEVPVVPELAGILQWHRERLVREQHPGVGTGYMFPSSAGTLRTPSSLDKAWKACLTKAGLPRDLTPHSLRYTFANLLRRAKVDNVARRALTGHVTSDMQSHYENDVELGEKRAAVAAVIRLAPVPREKVGTAVGTTSSNEKGRRGESA